MLSQWPKAGVKRSIKLANFCGRGLIAKENRPMKLLNHDNTSLLTSRVTTVTTKSGRRRGRRSFYVALFFWLQNNSHM